MATWAFELFICFIIPDWGVLCCFFVFIVRISRFHFLFFFFIIPRWNIATERPSMGDVSPKTLVFLRPLIPERASSMPMRLRVSFFVFVV